MLGRSDSVSKIGTIYAMCSILILIAFVYLNVQQAFADGLTQENLSPASLGNREGSPFVKINPPIYTTETEGDTLFQSIIHCKYNRISDFDKHGLQES